MGAEDIAVTVEDINVADSTPSAVAERVPLTGTERMALLVGWLFVADLAIAAAHGDDLRFLAAGQTLGLFGLVIAMVASRRTKGAAGRHHARLVITWWLAHIAGLGGIVSILLTTEAGAGPLVDAVGQATVVWFGLRCAVGMLLLGLGRVTSAKPGFSDPLDIRE